MLRSATSLNFGDVELSINYLYYPPLAGFRGGRSIDAAPEDAMVEIDTIKIDDKDVTEIIREDIYERCVQRALENGYDVSDYM